MASGYEDIDRWSSDSKTLLQQQQEKQEEITNRQTQLAVDELARQKEQLDKDTTKTTRGLYTDYQKQANQYGVNAEKQAQMGLANSGYSETAQVNLYNGYQKSVTETLNNSRQLKSDFDFKIAQAREQGNITLAQNALALYQQQMQLLTQEYEMRNNRKQFLYQQERDRVSDNQWQQQWDYQKQRDSVEDNRWQTQFDYQKQRDAVADSQWEKQYALSKKASASRSSSRSSSKKKSSGGGSQVGGGVSDYAITVANSLKNWQNAKGIAGKFSGAVVSQGKQTVAELVNQGKLSNTDAEYIFNQIGG